MFKVVKVLTSVFMKPSRGQLRTENLTHGGSYSKDFSGDRVLGSVVSLIGRQLVSTETSVGIENLL